MTWGGQFVSFVSFLGCAGIREFEGEWALGYGHKSIPSIL